jgi:peptidylprolyl isomerase
MSIDLKTAQSLNRHVKNASFQILLSNKRVVQGWILGLKKLEMSDKRGLRLPTLLTY